MTLFRKQTREAMAMVVSAAKQSVEHGRYPNLRLALIEMAANQRKATRLGVDIHDLLKESER